LAVGAATTLTSKSELELDSAWAMSLARPGEIPALVLRLARSLLLPCAKAGRGLAWGCLAAKSSAYLAFNWAGEAFLTAGISGDDSDDNGLNDLGPSDLLRLRLGLAAFAFAQVGPARDWLPLELATDRLLTLAGRGLAAGVTSFLAPCSAERSLDLGAARLAPELERELRDGDRRCSCFGCCCC